MTEPRPTSPAPPLDAYLDRVLEGEELARVERQIAADPGAVAEARLQGEIDASLKRLFDREAIPAAIPMKPAARSRRAWYLGIAAAAAVAVAAVGIYSVTVLSQPRPDVAGVYAAEVAAGFKPQEVCTTPEAFAGWLQAQYGAPLYPAGSLEGVRFVGWNYARAISGYSGVLLAEVDHRQVVVVVDKADREGRRPASPDDASLHMFRAKIGAFVLYELTPLDKARILPILADHPSRME